MRNRICFIIPYFGKFPNYFNLFLRSCSYNEDYKWLIFTDDKTVYNYPSNVEVHTINFKSFVAKVQEKFDFPLSLESPYKLCDYKPAYGYLFEDYLANCQYWGHCDIDIILGCLNSFLMDDLLIKYDKLFCLGHMTIYKNTPENNRIFMSEFHGSFLYKECFQNKEICWFDEEYNNENNINQIFLSQGKQVYTHDIALNISQRYSMFHRTIYHGIQHYAYNHGYEIESYNPAIYLWKKGHLCRYRKSNGNIELQEFPYIHLQGRKMSIDISVNDIDEFQIIPNRFIQLSKDITLDTFDSIEKGDNLKNRVNLFAQRLYKKIIKKTLRIIK